ncbi:unnamed protein product [Kuraishia capsulata CBS 1993]|uniref:beta-glucosidase n=1 Tax=Kuraishia capsulata CBS 1993 TaxID=1382522 RepID=W6MGV7_9ASCO|nr:uncharacterized protein KUCA_T00001399001 [Kuraishia capsulata CBS 1993]CDK25429.1 unnamed protein product [Kuraishia capsulata CBS 1993]
MTFTKAFDVEEVLEQLTLREKIALVSGLDTWHSVPIPRLGVPSIRVSDGPNGVRGTKFFNGVPTACIPSGTGLGATWDQELLNYSGRMMADQARAKGAHVLMGPTINMARSPLAGRSFECLSEDPFLTGLLSANYVRGVQDGKIGTCPKHMVCNDKEDDRMTLNVVVSERAMREIYLTPFMLTEKYAKPWGYMTSYSKLNGKHCSENSHLLQDIVRGEWGFDGFFVSDWFGVVSCADSLNAGLDWEMPGPSIWRGKLLEFSVFHKTVHEETLNDAARNMLNLVNKCIGTGVPENAFEGEHDTPDVREWMEKLASDQVVLLKNKNKILPFRKDKKVLVIGEGGKVPTYCSGGCTMVEPYYTVSPYDAIETKIGAGNVKYTLGAPLSKAYPSVAFFSPKFPDVKDPITFSVYDDARTIPDRVAIKTEAVSTVDAILGDFDPALLRDKEMLYAKFLSEIVVPESGYYSFSLQVSGQAKIFIDDEPVLINDLEHKTSSAFGLDAPEVFKDVYFESGKTYTFELDFESTPGKSSFITGYGSVTCGMTKTHDAEKCIAEAAALAKDFDQVVLLTGLNKDYEVEGIDRKHMGLPPFQDKLVEEVLKANANTVVVIESGTPVTMPWVDSVDTLLHSAYAGSETGTGIANVLFGDVNPNAKLPMTYPKKMEDSGSHPFFEVSNGNLVYGDDIFVGYRYFEKKKIEPLFPFGYGLSYTTFELSGLELRDSADGNDLVVSIKVSNTGSIAGAEVVQLYVSFKSSLVDRAEKELKGFAKVFLEPGQTKEATIIVEKKLATSFFNERLNKWTSEQGTYTAWVGTSSVDPNALLGRFTTLKTVHWSGL